MGTITKIIYAIRNGQSKKIRLFCTDGSNNFKNDIETGVDANDTIRWQLADNSGLESLVAVERTVKGLLKLKNPNNVALLTVDSVPEIQPSVFEGTVISESPGLGKFQTYKVGFKVPDDDKIYWEDPKLIMKT